MANLHLRTASRVLMRVAEFEATAFHELERHARKLPWELFLTPGRRVRWRVTCRKSRLYHQGAVEQRFREAAERATGAATPSAGPTGEEGDAEGEMEGVEEQLFVVRFLHDRCTISADTSGALLHRRGYRQAITRAPLRETLAAATLAAARWKPTEPLIDPMCGSGTIPIEAALIARRIPPGLASTTGQPRAFAFQEWPNFDAGLWNEIVDRARAGILPAAPAPILASDRDEGAIAATLANAGRAGVAAEVTVSARAVSAVEPPSFPSPGWLVTNPPYGLRVGENDRLRDLYAALGRMARDRLPGWGIALLSADRRLEGQVGVRFGERLATRNGGVPVRVVVGRAPLRTAKEGEDDRR